MLYFAIALVGLIIASYSDLKTREIPPLLPYSLIVIGFFLHGIESITTQEPNIFFFTILVGVFSFLFANSLYKFGVWAGGDVKLFTGLGFILPTFGHFDFAPFFILAISLLAIFPFLTAYVGYFFIRNPKAIKESKKHFKTNFLRAVLSPVYVLSAYTLCQFLGISWIFAILIIPLLYKARIYGLLIAIFLFFGGFYPDPTNIILSTFYILIASFVFFMGLASFRTASTHILREKIKVKALKEGMISAQDVSVRRGKAVFKEPTLLELMRPGKNLIIDSRKARGLTRSEIRKLKKLKVKELIIKKSMPFVPVFTLGLIILFLLEKLLYL